MRKKPVAQEWKPKTNRQNWSRGSKIIQEKEILNGRYSPPFSDYDYSKCLSLSLCILLLVYYFGLLKICASKLEVGVAKTFQAWVWIDVSEL